MRKTILFFTVICLSVSVGCNQSPSPAPTIETTRTLNLKANQYSTLSFNLETGDLVEGSFAVEGPSSLDIKFAIQDPTGQTVYGPVRARSESFTYRAASAGIHNFFIDNSYSLFTSKVVRLTFKIPRHIRIEK